jgi:hypothetical protein
VVRDLIAAASDDPNERMAAKSRFTQIFRAAARPESDGHGLIPACGTVLTQFERLQQFHDGLESK